MIIVSSSYNGSINKQSDTNIDKSYKDSFCRFRLIFVNVCDHELQHQHLQMANGDLLLGCFFQLQPLEIVCDVTVQKKNLTKIKLIALGLKNKNEN